MLYGAMPWLTPFEDTLVTSGVTAGTTAIEFTDGATWKHGHYGEFVPDGEIVRLTADHPSSGTVVMRRGQRGTTAASQSVGDVVRRNPTFEINRILHWLDYVVDYLLWEGETPLWTWVHRSFTWDDEDYTVQLNSADDEVARVYQIRSDTGDTADIVELPRGSGQGGYWDVMRATDTAVDANQKVLVVRKVWDSTKTVYYTAKQKPRSSDYASIDARVADIVPLEAAARVLLERTAAADRNRPENSPPALSVADRWRRQFRDDKRNIHNELRREVPTSPTWKPTIGGSRLVRGRW